jgi:hypothetical protein
MRSRLGPRSFSIVATLVVFGSWLTQEYKMRQQFRQPAEVNHVDGRYVVDCRNQGEVELVDAVHIDSIWSGNGNVDSYKYLRPFSE